MNKLNFFLDNYAVLTEKNIISLGSKLSDLTSKYPKFIKQIEFIANNDPSPNHKYLDYAVKQLVSGQALENEIVDVINLFHKYQNKLDQKDINQWNFTKLRDKLFELKGSKSKREETNEIKSSGATKVYEDEQVVVLHVKNKAAACFYGSGTKWCITMDTESYFEHYDASNVVFYFILNKILPQDNNDYKIAIAIQRDESNKILAPTYYEDDPHEINSDYSSGIEYFNAEDTKISEQEVALIVKNWMTIKNIIFSQAPKHPKGFLAILKSDPRSLTEQDYLKNLNLGQNKLLIAQNKNLDNIPDSVFDILSKDPDMRVRDAVAAHPWAPANILEILSKDPDADVRNAVAQNDYLYASKSQFLLENLSKDTDRDVRRSVAENKNTPKHILQQLAQDPDPIVYHAILFNQHLTDDIIRTVANRVATNLAKTKLPHNIPYHQKSFLMYELLTITVIVNNEICPEDVLNQFADDTYPLQIREKIAKNKNTNLATLNKLIDPIINKNYNENRPLIIGIAGNPNSDGNLLRKIYNKFPMEDPIHYEIAKNHNIPNDLVESYDKRRDHDYVLDLALRQNTYLTRPLYSHKDKKFMTANKINNIIKNAYIRKLPNGKYRVFSEKGKNMGTFPTRDKAKKHLSEIEFFKRQCDDNASNDSQKSIDLTDIDDLSYSAIMRKLYQKTSQKHILLFMQIYKSEFDAAVKKELQKPDKIALQKTLIKFNQQYKIALPKKFVKNAAVAELGSSEQVGQYLSNIIKFIFNRISPLNRQHSLNNLKQKLYALDIGNISEKKMPASSAIGQAITFVKHVLFSHDPQYVREVIQHTVNLL